MRRLGIALIAILVIVVLVASGFVIWANTPPAPMAEALAALESDTAVTVDQSRWIVFTPSDVEPTTGFIFYPGGRVDARSYAPTLKAIAQQGYLAVIVPMPLNLAIFGIDGADDVIAAVGKACARNQSNVSSTHHCDFHESWFRFLGDAAADVAACRFVLSMWPG